MAELALAIIPLGLKTCSGLAATQALRCLANCKNGLKELKAFGQKISATATPDPAVKERVKGSYRRLSYPLRQAQLSQLENALDGICTPLNLAIQGLQLEMQAITSKEMILNATAAKNIALEISALSAAVSHLSHPVSTIHSQLPSIQITLDELAPEINLMIQAHFKTQMDEIRVSFQQAESAALQRNAQTGDLLSRLSIGRAIELTVRTTIGAGGFSISPSVNYFTMVDEMTSPAFRVVNLLVESRLGARWAMESYPGILFESITRKLQVIFRSGNARPTDVNSRGYSLLHHLTLTMHSGDFRILTQQQRAHPGLKSLFDFLITAGTPVSAVGSDGRLALHIAADEFVLPSSILAQLCVDDVEIPAPRRPELRFGSFGRIDILKYDSVSRRIAEALYGPLTLAILRNDVKEVEDLINRSPDFIGEISFYGESPCFVARNIFGMVVSFNLFIGASAHCKLLLARKLQMLQQEFEGLAPRTLPRTENLRSSATQLYVRSNGLGYLFQRQANTELTALPNEPTAEIGCKGVEKPISRPVWLDITCPGDASIFWHMGFSDIDDACIHQSLSQQAFDAFGPDITQVLHSEIIINNRKNLKKYLIRDPLAIEYTDRCTCQCSPEGYTPFTHGIRCLLESYSSDIDELRSFVEDFGGILTMHQHTAVLRQAVFANLDMVHTCSARPDFSDEPLNDRVYTATDDGDKAAFIDSVIIDFRRFMLRDADATDCERENYDMYLFRETMEYYQRALEFWDHVLPSMLGKFEQTLASTWKPDPETLKDLGVTLWIEEEKKQEVCARVYEVRRDDEESRRMAFKELMDKLEMIE
ncbi:hypothetical protein FPHYL_10938 [Fusarium phyllophilum]|uniref:Uncharacterized protein n=1 Tax=Fusarium phyllophilum TaxID=47803 RepID=A0A8H5IXS0_9HYPO|nr:hypothetical protein FPHYL_10938 [Fusarium phyllophilum]